MDILSRKYMNTHDAAGYIGLGKSTLDKWRSQRSDGPRFMKLGRRVVYRVEDLDNWVAENRRHSTSAYSMDQK